MTAGNSSGHQRRRRGAGDRDREEGDSELGRKPLARILAYCTVGVDPMIMGMGPVEAMRKAVERAGLSLDGSRPHRAQRSFRRAVAGRRPRAGLDPAKVNVHGGAIALGHPIGASGARILTTLVHALQARGGGRGAASLCIGGGMGTAMIVEAQYNH